MHDTTATVHMTLPSRFTRLVGVRQPVMQEGLGPYKTVHLAAAVANAGGFGTVSIPGISEEVRHGARLLHGYQDERLITGQRDGDRRGGILPCGQIAGALTELIDVAGFVPGMVHDAAVILRRLAALGSGPETTATERVR